MGVLPFDPVVLHEGHLRIILPHVPCRVGATSTRGRAGVQRLLVVPVPLSIPKKFEKVPMPASVKPMLNRLSRGMA